MVICKQVLSVCPGCYETLEKIKQKLGSEPRETKQMLPKHNILKHYMSDILPSSLISFVFSKNPFLEMFFFKVSSDRFCL